MDIVDLLSAAALLAIIVLAFRLGRQSNALAAMEVKAAAQVVKQEVGWEFQRYRIESLRMDWVALDPSARKEYTRTWPRPKWATTAGTKDPLEGIAPVHVVRGRD